MSTSKTTTIRVSLETYEELSKQGTVVDSFDSVIKQLLNMKMKKDKTQEVHN